MLARLRIALRASALLALPMVMLLCSVASGNSEAIRLTANELDGAGHREAPRQLAADLSIYQQLDFRVGSGPASDRREDSTNHIL